VAWAVGQLSESTLLASTCAVAVLAALTRGLHLDGLADVADGLGSRRPPDEARAIMRRSDVGPFGVATVLIALLLQVAAIQVAMAASTGTGGVALVAGAVVSRTAVAVACRRGVPAASNGLGSQVVGTVSKASAAVLSVTVVVLVAASGFVAAGRALVFGGASLATLLLAEWWRRHCARRLGAVTGDVLGATEEVAFTVFVLVVALSV
jgi:adenosylcobinamide-GDP ribazoletransferase